MGSKHDFKVGNLVQVGGSTYHIYRVTDVHWPDVSITAQLCGAWYSAPDTYHQGNFMPYQKDNITCVDCRLHLNSVKYLAELVEEDTK